MNGKVYMQGETIAVEVADSGYDSVSLRVGGQSAIPLTLTDGKWSGVISTAALSGEIRYAVLAQTGSAVCCVAEGTAFVRVMRSRYRDVVEAINAAIEKVAINGKYSVSVGEISLQDKTFDEMVNFVSYYKGLAEADETGTAVTGRVGSILMEF